ncbi:CASP-like protein 1D1 isoform X2 [Punica granatum]|uniref:CASP-like protein n=1 Tax=Punica granatum TaxID=22663 RepID=A0A6P8C7A6_PUNGR|nr:CASP-like protein 1D1 isoform X2 [Punica granatum]
MASTEKPVDVEAGKVEEAPPPLEPEAAEAPPPEAEGEAPPKAEREAPPPPPPINTCILVDGILRLLVFAAALAAVVVIATSDQTEAVPVPGQGSQRVEAKFTQSPALIYVKTKLRIKEGVAPINSKLDTQWDSISWWHGQ